MISKKGKNQADFLTKQMKMVEKLDETIFEIENMLEYVPTVTEISIYEDGLAIRIAGLPLEECYLLCGDVKRILEKTLVKDFVRWTRHDWPNLGRSVDFTTFIDDFIRVSLVCYPSDCSFEIVGSEQKPVYKLNCGGAE